MTASAPPLPETAVSVPSERLRLARVALAAALRVPGVVRADAGPSGTCVTASGRERLQGIRCVWVGDGYELTLRLVCRMVPLPDLGQRVRAAVTRTADVEEVHVESVNVHIAGLIGEAEL